MLLRKYHNKKAQKEKVGTPTAIFKAERVGVTDTFKKLNERRNLTLERTNTYPVYYEFTDKDLASIHSELIGDAEYQLRANKDIGWILEGNDFINTFSLFGEAEIQNGKDYEYHITHDTLPKKKVELDFKSLKKIEQ